MAVDSSGIDAGVLSLLNQSNKGTDGFGMNGLLGIAALRMLMPGYGMDGTKPLAASDVQNIVADQSNTKTLGDLKGDLGAVSKEIWTAEGQVQNAIMAATLSNKSDILASQIAQLQSAKDITKDVSNLGVLNSSQHAAITTTVLENRYELEKAITNDGDKTRTAISQLAMSIPNARELDLQRQLTVALDNERHRDILARVESGNVSVTTNVNQNQFQMQQQQQLQTVLAEVNALRSQQAMATAINVGGYQRATQTPTNISQ